VIEKGSIHNLTISSLGINGEGVAKIDGFTVFVEGALPQEEVTAAITSTRPSYAKASLISINKADGARVLPPCSRYAECGGCQIMHLAYDAQLMRKAQLVKDALKHIGGLADADVLPCIPSPEAFHYRNKIQLPVGRARGKIVTGFYRRGSHDIVPYERCLIHHPSMEETVVILRSLVERSKIEPYCEATTKGTLRHMLIRANADGEQLIGLVTTGRESAAIAELARAIMAAAPYVVGVVLSINKKVQNVILGEKAQSLAGTPYLTERIGGLRFRISMESFFQVNLKAAQILYDTAINSAQIDNTTTVLDAYCGTGTMSLLAARQAKTVIGAECVSQAVRDAERNARENNITNVKFVVGKVEERTELFRGIDVALVNPPRKGLDARVVMAIDDFGPRRLVYVSCNPATLARDVKMLTNYRLINVQPVDMFPQTMHVESVAVLERI
jgi:23S rRNA (uracil1939-C5)-methyltransferase